MTIRDLTPKQIQDLRKRCKKEGKEHLKLRGYDMKNLDQNLLDLWQDAFAKGLKAGMEFVP